MSKRISSRVFILVTILLTTAYIFADKLPTAVLGISLEETYEEIKRRYILKKVNISNNTSKTYEKIYTEESNIKTYISFFNSKVFKITVIYLENFVDETDWENIYNQAVIQFGEPKKVFLEMKNNIVEENYLWEDENVKQIYKRISENGKFRNFYIILVDKQTEQKIKALSPIEKLYYKIINLF